MRFEAQLIEARRERAEKLPSFASSSTDAERALERAGLLRRAEVPAEVHIERLRSTLAAAMDVPSLDTLHRALPDFSVRPEHHKAVNAAKKRLMQPLTDTAAAAPFLAAYDALLCEVIAPHVAEAMGDEGCDALHYSAFPTLRVQHPSGYGGIRPHCDGIYDLQPGSLNWWVALTHPLRPCRTLHVESAPGADDFSPLLPAAGALVRFDGRRCLHFTRPNLSARTRVSLDFRVVPGGHFEPDNRLSRWGYFATVARGADGRFAKAADGRLSVLHGIPHTAPYREVRVHES